MQATPSESRLYVPPTVSTDTDNSNPASFNSSTKQSSPVRQQSHRFESSRNAAAAALSAAAHITAKLNPKNLFSRQNSSQRQPGSPASTDRPRTVRIKPRRVTATQYSFGSPRVGNRSFAQFYERIVPDTFRVVVDGDLVTGLPKAAGYKHVGTCVLIDGQGAGSIIIGPSFVEKWLRAKTTASVSAHSLLLYRKGLLGVMSATEYLRRMAEKTKMAPRLTDFATLQLPDYSKEAGKPGERVTEEQYHSGLVSGLPASEAVKALEEGRPDSSSRITAVVNPLMVSTSVGNSIRSGNTIQKERLSSGKRDSFTLDDGLVRSLSTTSRDEEPRLSNYSPTVQSALDQYACESDQENTDADVVELHHQRNMMDAEALFRSAGGGENGSMFRIASIPMGAAAAVKNIRALFSNSDSGQAPPSTKTEPENFRPTV